MRAASLSGTRRWAAVLVATVAVAMIPAAADPPHPPTNLKLVGDHWTPWDPPDAGPDSYVIQRGDTLWDLAAQWLDDPYLWPQIWDENRYILDSHWIYPGDPLVIPGRPNVVPDDGPPVISRLPEPTDPPEVIDTTPPALAPKPLALLATPSDLYCSGWIASELPAVEASVAGGELERITNGQGDVVYLDRGRDWGIRAGDELQLQRPTREVVHPETGVLLGTFVQRLGKARVLVARETTSIAVIEMACDAIVIGDSVVGWEEIPVPQRDSIPEFVRYDVEPSGGPVGTILETTDDWHIIGEGHVIGVDLGELSGVRPGDVMTLYRDNGDLPRMNIGQGVVLTVEPETAMVRVNHSIREALFGDKVEVLR